MKRWKVTASFNMNMDDIRTITVAASNEHWAKVFAKEKFKKLGAWMIVMRSIEEIKEDDDAASNH